MENSSADHKISLFRLVQVRAKLYELITHNIPADVILKKLTFALIDKVSNSVDADFTTEVLHWASIYVRVVIWWSLSCRSETLAFALQDHRQQLGSKPIFHLEAFVAKFLELWKSALVKLVS